jgi:hypothetical protein
VYVKRSKDSVDMKYESGIPVGYIENGEYFIYNHHEFTISLQKTFDDQTVFRVIGFKVEPFS